MKKVISAGTRNYAYLDIGRSHGDWQHSKFKNASTYSHFIPKA